MAVRVAFEGNAIMPSQHTAKSILSIMESEHVIRSPGQSYLFCMRCPGTILSLTK